MHTDLSAHLHTERCNRIIEMLRKCHADYPFRKFFGECNSVDSLMNACLKQERLARRDKNMEKSKEMKRKLREMILDELEEES
ncbi:COX assembly mitochondrial protein 2 homolog [Diabrotica virgifera virgifera]|uniref:COX assembly mitochondrial protein n=1 Tax=Diabrotica virgifera virgifera TaxID=50390 RepID=A0ABM5KZP3_DIAVI|nr:COX assembly mitochondrial protein 2 homolog [Diabrotica virgifera virgifera]